MQSISSTMNIQKAMMQRTPSVASRRSLVVNSVAESGRQSEPAPFVRHFAAAAAALQLIAMPAQAMWDGTSSATGSCALGDAGDECRKATLAKDELESYSAAMKNTSKIGSMVTGVPVSDLGTQYAKDTAALSDKILTYLTADVYDENRPALVKEIKAESQTWVSKYARGGSARTVSARKFYIAVDAVQGHLASNGFAPFPRNKIQRVVDDVNTATALIAEGK